MITSPDLILEVTLDDVWFDLDDLCRLGVVEACWLEARLADGLLPACVDAPDSARCYNALTLARLRRLACLERDYDAVPELAALVVDLEDEVRRLRHCLIREKDNA